MADSRKTDEGGFAFPTSALFTPEGKFLSGGSDGMSLRDWFAGQALVGLIPAYQAAYGSPTAECMEVVREAYGYADIMIAHRTGGA